MRALVWCCCLLLVALEWSPAGVGAVSRKKACRRACGAAVDACVASGGKHRRCKRQTLKRCRKEGLETCTVTTTTTAPAGGSTTTTSGDGGSSTTTVPGPGGSTTTLETINGCTTASAVDRTAGDRTVTFAPFAYVPPCIRIAAGQSVTFSGLFGSHPISGGEVVSGNPVADPSSPIPQFYQTGTLLVVPFPNAGVFPYYCNLHLGPPLEMEGVVYVDP